MAVTVAVVPRERYSATRESLESIYAHTAGPFDLVYIDGGSPPDVKRYLEEASRRLGFTLVRTDHNLDTKRGTEPSAQPGARGVRGVHRQRRGRITRMALCARGMRR